jgi:hypothetical protein
MLYEGPEGQIVQNIESRAPSWQACVSHQRYFVRCTKEYVDAMASEVDLLGELIRIVNGAQDLDALDERRLYDPKLGERRFFPAKAT